MNQGKLFDIKRPTSPRKTPCKRGTLMQVWDAGGMDSMMVRFKCQSCQHETDWTPVATVTEAKRGKPCPVCNKEKP